MGEYPGWDIAVSPTKERIPHTVGDSLRSVAAVGWVVRLYGKGILLFISFLSGRRTGEAAYKEYNRTLSRFNHDLKLLARSTGVTLPVTSYTIRHSFASFLKEQDVSIEVISELLGHKSIKTTQIYLKSFSLERLSKVNRNCFESVCKPIPKVG